MANKILLRRNSTASAAPTAAQIEPGELAINTADGRLFTELNNGTIVNLPVQSIAGQAITPSTVRTSGTADAVLLSGGDSGTASRFVTLKPASLTGNRTALLPDSTGTVALSYDGSNINQPSPVNQLRQTLRNNLGDPTVEEAALFHAEMYNHLRFRPPALQEESADGGTTWTTSTRVSAAALGDMMRGEGEGTNVNILPAGSSTPIGYRLTWDSTATGLVYWIFNHLYINCSTNGNTTTFTVEAEHNTNGWTQIFSDSRGNYPGHVSIKHTGIAYYPTNAGAYGKIRITFMSTTVSTPVTLYAIEWFGGYPSGKRNAESYDRDKNVTFPNQISGHRLTSRIGTGTSPLAVSSTTVCTNLNADTVDGYHNTDFFRNDTNVWQTTADGKNRFYFAANSRTYYGSHDGHEFRDSGGTGRFFITNAGNVGVGNSAPPAPLSVGNSSVGNSDGYISIGKNNNAGGARIMRMGFDADFNFTIGDWGSNNAAPSTWVSAFKINYATPANTLTANASGHVGIGTAAPTTRLTVFGLGTGTMECGATGHGGNYTGISFNNSGNSNVGVNIFSSPTDQTLYFNRPSGNSIRFREANVDQVIIASNGDVGIGTLTPAAPLTIRKDVGTTTSPGAVFGDMIAFKAYYTGFDTETVKAAIGSGVDGITNWNTRNGLLTFSTSNGGTLTERMRIMADGNVGIGTTAPNARLHAQDATALSATDTQLNTLLLSAGNGSGLGARHGIQFRANSNADTVRVCGIYQVVENASANSTGLSFHTSNWTSAGNFNVERVRIANNGSVGIGVTAPGSRLVVKGEGITTATSALNVTNSSDASLLFVRNDGNVGIGTTTPAARLEVSGTSTAAASQTAGIFKILGSATNALTFGTLTGGPFAGYIQSGGSSTYPLSLNPLGGNVGVGTTAPNYRLEVNGSFAATTKSFRIKHPSKPNHILEYGSLESPYHGVRLTGRGKVIGSSGQVALPEYLKNLVHDDERVTIQLTNYRHGKLLYVSAIDLQHDAFFVACDTSSDTDLEFFWCLTAVRKDIDEMVVERTTEFGF